MKALLLLLLAVAALVVAGAIFVADIFAEQGGHDGDSRERRIPFAAQGMSREQYIRHLLQTESRNDPELWTRIEAVKNLKVWPE